MIEIRFFSPPGPSFGELNPGGLAATGKVMLRLHDACRAADALPTDLHQCNPFHVWLGPPGHAVRMPSSMARATLPTPSNGTDNWARPCYIYDPADRLDPHLINLSIFALASGVDRYQANPTWASPSRD